MNRINYIYLGKKLPQYASSSIDLANLYSGLPLTLIGNKSMLIDLNRKNIDFVAVEDFYCKDEFESVKNKFIFSHEFRNGFWLKTLERFFVMEQYMKLAGLHSILHAEIDQLLFRIDDLVENLENLETQGIFLPFHTNQTAVASVFYCNKLDSLRSFLNFTQKPHEIVNEMELLAAWSQENPSQVFTLPSLGTKLKTQMFENSLKNRILSEAEVGGLLDPLQLGPWVGGNDPRNEVLTSIPKNKYVEGGSNFLLSEKELMEVNFSFAESSGHLSLTEKGSRSIVYNLHFHSKLHNWLKASESPVGRLLFLANSQNPVAVRAARVEQIKYRTTYFFRETALSIKKNPLKITTIPFKLVKNLKYFSKVVAKQISRAIYK